MKNLMSAFSLLLLLCLISCETRIQGTGDSQPETRSLTPFTEIESHSSLDITYRQISDGVDRVVVLAQQNILPYIKTEVEDGTLSVYIEGNIDSDDKMSVQVYARNLNMLNLNGSGDFKIDGKLNVQKFYAENNGSGDVDIKIQASSIEVESNGSGDFDFSGTSDYLEIELNGSGDVTAEDLRVFNSEVEINGSGDVSVFAKELLEIELNGSGDVKYKGRAKIEQTINGSGRVFSL